MIIGLDALDPRVLFAGHGSAFPRLSSLARRGTSGRLRSTIPPITVPAWVTMTSGMDPGELGIYGFHGRIPCTYDTRLHDSTDVRAPRIWDLAARSGLRSIVLGVPLTYPPPGDMDGVLAGDPLMPCSASEHSCPGNLKTRIEERFGPFVPDVEGFRNVDRAVLADRILAVSDQHFRIAEWLAQGLEWDLFMMVDMGIDRFQHAFFRHLDPGHPTWRSLVPDRAGREAASSFLAAIDEHAGRLFDIAGPETTVIVVSDHGARSLEGGFAVNEWLEREGYLHRDGSGIDWSRTSAWGEGGYVARMHLNIEGREPCGIVRQGREGPLLSDIASRLESLAGPDAKPMRNRCLRPRDVYRSVRGLPPDLLVELGGLAYRSIGSFPGTIFTTGNDTGADDANHDNEGIFVMAGPGIDQGGRMDVRIEDVADLAARILGCATPPSRG